MKYSKVADTYLLRFETGEELVSAIARFANDRRVDTATIAGIGSVHHAVLGYYDRAAKEYLRRGVEDDCEIVSLAGNIALKDGRPFAHVHVTLGTRDFQALAGHLFEAIVAATCEVSVRPLPGAFQRHKDDATGLYLLDV